MQRRVSGDVGNATIKIRWRLAIRRCSSREYLPAHKGLKQASFVGESGKQTWHGVSVSQCCAFPNGLVKNAVLGCQAWKTSDSYFGHLRQSASTMKACGYEWLVPVVLCRILCEKILVVSAYTGFMIWLKSLQYSSFQRLLIIRLLVSSGISLAGWGVGKHLEHFGTMTRLTLKILQLFPMIWWWVIQSSIQHPISPSQFQTPN